MFTQVKQVSPYSSEDIAFFSVNLNKNYKIHISEKKLASKPLFYAAEKRKAQPN